MSEHTRRGEPGNTAVCVCGGLLNGATAAFGAWGWLARFDVWSLAPSPMVAIGGPAAASEVDASGLWRIPTSRMKSRQPHALHLQGFALEHLSAKHSILRGNSLTQHFARTCRKLSIDDLRLHDLRRSAATHLGDADVSSDAIAAMLAHASTSGATSIYMRSRREAQAAEALKEWTRLLDSIVTVSRGGRIGEKDECSANPAPLDMKSN